jgi:type VI secretion system protein ImpM
MASMGSQAAPGWHGKLPSLGDFASRRLARDFLDPWDHWLASGMQALREQRGDGWLDAYLSSPSWRFLLMPGALAGAPGAQGWAGVLMPSVDRVGRYFPFTVVAPLADDQLSLPQMPALWSWLGRLDDLAAEAMQDDWGVERLEAELARMAGPALQPLPLPPAHPLVDGELAAAALVPGLDASAWIALEAQTPWRAQAQGLAYWFAQAEGRAPRLLRSRGLPLPAALGELFGATPVQAL